MLRKVLLGSVFVFMSNLSFAEEERPSREVKVEECNNAFNDYLQSFGELSVSQEDKIDKFLYLGICIGMTQSPNGAPTMVIDYVLDRIRYRYEIKRID